MLSIDEYLMIYNLLDETQFASGKWYSVKLSNPTHVASFQNFISKHFLRKSNDFKIDGCNVYEIYEKEKSYIIEKVNITQQQIKEQIKNYNIIKKYSILSNFVQNSKPNSIERLDFNKVKNKGKTFENTFKIDIASSHKYTLYEDMSASLYFVEKY